MFVALSIGILTALTGTGMSQVAPAFADKEECEDNDDNNCNERTHKIIQDDNCKAVNEYEAHWHHGYDEPTINLIATTTLHLRLTATTMNSEIVAVGIIRILSK